MTYRLEYRMEHWTEDRTGYRMKCRTEYRVAMLISFCDRDEHVRQIIAVRSFIRKAIYSSRTAHCCSAAVCINIMLWSTRLYDKFQTLRKQQCNETSIMNGEGQANISKVIPCHSYNTSLFNEYNICSIHLVHCYNTDDMIERLTPQYAMWLIVNIVEPCSALQQPWCTLSKLEHNFAPLQLEDCSSRQTAQLHCDIRTFLVRWWPQSTTLLIKIFAKALNNICNRVEQSGPIYLYVVFQNKTNTFHDAHSVDCDAPRVGRAAS